MIHLRIVAPPQSAAKAIELLCASDSVSSVIHLPGTAHKPSGDVIMADVAREDTSVILSDLRELNIPKEGSIALEVIDSELSEASQRAEKAAGGLPSDAVIWEEVESRTSEDTELSFSFVAFMVLAMLIAMAGILLDQTILIIGAMVVGPEFGPIAGFCVAAVQRRGDLARRSIVALAVGFPAGIVFTFVVALAIDAFGLTPGAYEAGVRSFTAFISEPDFFSVFVAFIAGVAGVLSLTAAKSGALVGVVISVTTIPAAANIGVAAAYKNWDEFGGAAAMLGINLFTIGAAGVLTLYVQRLIYVRRRKHHLLDPAREAAGLPMGRSARGTLTLDTRELETVRKRRER